ncbi:t-SNARE [Martensiomyces pterosporus]|nr:t-SNARE [Martensiomyces pterosporus]
MPYPQELQLKQNKRDSLESLSGLTDITNVNLSYQIDGLTISTEANFARVAGDVNEHISILERNIGQIERLHGEAIYSTSPFKHTQALRTREKYSEDTDIVIVKIRASLQVMEHAANDPNLHKGDRLMRGGRHIALARRFRDQIEQYRKMERDQATRNRDRLSRLYKIACPDATEEEIYMAIDDEMAAEIFAQKVMQSSRAGEARSVLKDVTDRQGDIANIEHTVSELTKVHSEVSEMVNRQQAKLDNITVAIERVEASVRGGNVEKALRLSSRPGSRKRTWLVIALLIFVIVAAAVTITLAVLKSKGRI